MLVRLLSTQFAATFLIASFLPISFFAALKQGFSQEVNDLVDSSRTEDSKLFRERIAPILASRCHACHGVKQEGGYSVATPAQLFLAGDSESLPIVAKDLHRSELWLRLVSEDESERMPVDAAPLTKDQLAAIQNWIEAGAPVEPSDQQRSMTAIAVSRVVAAPVHYPRPLAINALAIAGNAETVWVGGYAELTQWRVATGELLVRLPVSGPHVAAIALVPGGSSLVVSSGSPGQRGVIERISLSDSISNREALDATFDVAPDLAMTKDGHRVAIGGNDGSLRVVELLSDHRFGQIVSMTPHADAILALAWSDDGKHLVTASRDRTAKLFDGEKMELIASYDRHERAVGGSAFSGSRPLSLDETGRLRLMAGDDSDGVVVEQAGLPRVLKRFVTSGEKIFISDRNRVREFRIETNTVDDGKDEEGKLKSKRVSKFREGSVLEVDTREWITSVVITESALAVGTQQGTITVWDRSTNQRLGVFLAKP